VTRHGLFPEYAFLRQGGVLKGHREARYLRALDRNEPTGTRFAGAHYGFWEGSQRQEPVYPRPRFWIVDLAACAITRPATLIHSRSNAARNSWGVDD
jgi:hypothetical protein